MKETLVLGRRALRETLRTPDSQIATFFIPLFFLIVNTGQAARIFPSGETGFLVVAVTAVVMTVLSVRLINNFD